MLKFFKSKRNPVITNAREVDENGVQHQIYAIIGAADDLCAINLVSVDGKANHNDVLVIFAWEDTPAIFPTKESAVSYVRNMYKCFDVHGNRRDVL